MMQDAIKQMLTLQAQDVELDRLQAELAAVPRAIAAIKKQMDAEKAALEDSKKDLVQVQMKRKEKEVDLGAKEESVRKHTAELNSIKSNDAYRAMMGEIEKARSEKSALEDEILQLMDKVDQAQRVWKERETAAKAQEGQRQAEIAAWEAKQTETETRIADKQKERETVAANFAPALRQRYQRIREGIRGAVLVPLKKGQCSGCHMQVSPNLVNEVKRGQTVMTCEHCSRIVYLEEAAENPVAK
jgi:predicted  nucleic acid-binding Zn-ribbon protein